MGLLDGLRETFISRLQLTVVKSGTYLVVPNAQKPAFLIPAYSRKAFNQGIGLIKSISRKSEVKKILIKVTPLFLLKLKFPMIRIHNPNAGERDAVILPWNQGPASKITLILYDRELRNVEVEKHAFDADSINLLRNEKNFLTKLKTIKESNVLVPEVRDFRETDNHVCLVQNFHFGDYLQDIPSNVLMFFDKLSTSDNCSLEKHPYIIEKLPMITCMLKQHDCLDLLQEIEKLFDGYRHARFQVTTMHSDFTTTNVIHTDDDHFVIIDWEDADENGINIDVPFFHFRRHLDLNGSWEISDAEGLLVVLHYIWFMVSKQNIEMLRRFKIEQGVFSV